MAWSYGEVPQFHFTAEVKMNLGDYQSASVSFGLSRVPIDVTADQFEAMLDGVVVDMLGRVNERVKATVVDRLRNILGPYAENHEIVRQWGEEHLKDVGKAPLAQDVLTERQANMISALLKESWPDGGEARLALARLLADGGHIEERQVAPIRVEDFDKRLASTAIDVLKASTRADIAHALERARTMVRGAFA